MTPHLPSAGILYIVSTPIGNLGDMTQRAVNILKDVDLIAAEDTRVTGRLLAHFGIATSQTSYHDHNEKYKAPDLIKMLLSGKSLALVSDAGTPLISDPGYRLVNEAWSNNIDVIPVPGASSILAALVVSGFPTDSFCFEGYLPNRSGKLRSNFESLAAERRTMIFLETSHRILKSLPLMRELLNDREIFVGRELTKKFEEKFRGKISQVIESLAECTLKGEFVIVVRGADNA
jgi:16S rRNA (cytidine1402-2'-O)-methyltransferase